MASEAILTVEAYVDALGTRDMERILVHFAPDDLYVRSFRGTDGGWWRTAHANHEGHIRSGGVDKDVTFAEVADPEVNDRLDTAYRTKYGRFGDAYVDPMVAARPTTLKLVPR